MSDTAPYDFTLIECVEVEACAGCARTHTLDRLAVVIGEGLLCARCIEYLRERLRSA